MPAAMVHGGGGVLLLMKMKVASQQTNEKYNNCIKKAIKAPFLTTQYNAKQQHKITCKKNRRNQHPAPSNKLTVEMQFFQMSEIDQR